MLGALSGDGPLGLTVSRAGLVGVTFSSSALPQSHTVTGRHTGTDSGKEQSLLVPEKVTDGV